MRIYSYALFVFYFYIKINILLRISLYASISNYIDVRLLYVT